MHISSHLTAEVILSAALIIALFCWLMYSRRKASAYKNQFVTVFNSAAIGMATVSIEGKWLHVNPALCCILGYEESELQQLTFQSITYSEDVTSSIEYCEQLLSGKLKYFRIEKRYLHKQGHHFWACSTISLVRNKKNEPLYYIAQIQDITQQKKNEEQLTYQAYYDALTGLANRNQLEYNINKLIASARRYGQRFAIFFLDLDNFKHINDTLGHEAGDHLLKIIASRLKICIRTTDIAARLGGDEFILVITNLRNPEATTFFAEKIITALLEPIKIQEHELLITTSIGISFFPSDGTDYQTLTKNADLALYHAKENGRNNYQFCTPEISAKMRDKSLFESALHEALEKEEFQLFYQPKLSLHQEKIIGVEALLRWHSHRYGIITTKQIIPLAEETGVIISLGSWIIRTACTQIKQWQSENWPSLNIAINLSAREFNQPHLAETIRQQIEAIQLHPSNIEIEISETLIMQDPEKNIEILHSLKQLGVRIIIDDFGTGFSSLSYLQQFSTDYIKIDQLLIHDINTSSSCNSLIIAMIALAKNLGIKIIAEGVETKEQYDFIVQHGCDEAQGYYFCRPLPAKDLKLYFKKFTTDFNALQV
jgi:diguanylate cyclase (GGDEF)-like protein/PAS domain S-box-containing protein